MSVMTYTVSALSLQGDIDVAHSTAASALDFAMRLGSQGCRAVSITDAHGIAYDVTSFFRMLVEPGDPRVPSASPAALFA